MRFFSTLFSLLALSAQPTLAACMVCDQIVTLNAKLAACYLQNYDRWTNDLVDGTRPFATVDLSDCADPQDLEKDFAGLPVPGRTPRIKLVYILDMPGLECVRAELEGRSEPIDPLAQIDLFECATVQP